MHVPRVTTPLLLTGAAIAAAAPAGAAAATVKCPGDQYLLVAATPPVSGITARNLPKKTDGYAPRCLVAEAIVSLVQYDWTGTSGPKTLQVGGARWGAGKWRCTYRQPDGSAQYTASCKKAGKASRRVRFTIG